MARAMEGDRMKGSDLPLRIAVVGSGSAGSFEEVAEEVGAEIARRGAWLVCGGLGGESWRRLRGERIGTAE